jgi:hypothetical protein
MIWLILTTCVIAGLQVHAAMVRERATLRLGELLAVHRSWYELDRDKRVLGPFWKN